MKRNYWVPILIIFSIISICHADMYIWTDENGVKHYTDTPPANEVSPEQVEHSETSEYVFGHPGYNKNGDREYCEHQLLPSPENQTSMEYLYDVKKLLKRARESHQRYIDDQSLPNPPIYTGWSLRQNECTIAWATYTIEKIKNSNP